MSWSDTLKSCEEKLGSPNYLPSILYDNTFIDRQFLLRVNCNAFAALLCSCCSGRAIIVALRANDEQREVAGCEEGEFHVTCEMLLFTAESVAEAVFISNICLRECYCESDLCYSQTAGSR